MNNVAPHLQPVDKFFSASEARSDRWREMNAAANAWSSAKHDGAVPQQRALRLFDELSPFEDYWSYPGFPAGVLGEPVRRGLRGHRARRAGDCEGLPPSVRGPRGRQERRLGQGRA